MKLKHLLLVLFIPCSAVGEEPTDLRQKLQNEAPKAWSEYIQLASHTQGEVSSKATDRMTGKTIREEGPTQFKLNGLMGLYVGDSPKRLECENDRYTFLLEEKLPNEWSLKYFKWNKGSYKYKIDFRGAVTSRGEETIGSSACQIAIAYSSYGLLIDATWLPAMFNTPSFKIVDVTGADEQGEGLIRVKFEYEPVKTRNNPVRNGYVILDPSRYWLIKETEVDGYEPEPEFRFKIQSKNEFDDSVAGFPYVSRNVQRTVGLPAVDNDDVHLTKLRRMDESDIEPFRLRAYGFPEPDEASRSDKERPIRNF